MAAENEELKPGEAWVKPEGNWDKAFRVSVFTDDWNIQDVPLLRAKWTSAELSLHKDKYKVGIVIVSSKGIPTHDNKRKFKLKTKSQGKYDLKVDIEGDDEVKGVAFIYDALIPKPKSS